MRVLQFVLSFSPGGRREAMATLTSRLNAEGVESDLCCVDTLDCAESDLAGKFQSWWELKPKSKSESRTAQLQRIVQERRIDVIHCHCASSQFVATRTFWWKRSPPIVMTFHRSLSIESARWQDKARNAFAGMRCSAIIVGSRERWRHYTSENFIAKKKVIRIPFGIDTDKFGASPHAREEVRRELGVSESCILVGMMGHFGEEKGVDVGLKAFVECWRRAAAGKLALVVLGTGTAEQADKLRALAVDCGSGVHFAGFRKDRERYFAAMDLFLHTPRQEAFGLVVAEAMSTGLPVIATSVGGVSDIVRSEETGILIGSEDVKAAAQALQTLTSDREKLARFGQRGREIATTDYSAAVYGQRHVEMYRTVLEGRMLTNQA
jgi:glycosyltransferase involved in cell wall biosynthesis